MQRQDVRPPQPPSLPAVLILGNSHSDHLYAFWTIFARSSTAHCSPDQYCQLVSGDSKQLCFTRALHQCIQPVQLWYGLQKVMLSMSTVPTGRSGELIAWTSQMTLRSPHKWMCSNFIKPGNCYGDGSQRAALAQVV
ncbi:TPA: hypothetical protein ACH3X2_000815 [Trebouxia sp. C0005]